MKAIIYTNYGPPEILQLKEVEKPIPEENEVLVKVYATSLNWLDWHFLTGTPYLTRIMAGFLKPKNNILGIDLAGQVEKVGTNVKQFQPGDEVFGATGHGCFAEYVCVSEQGLVKKPANITFEQGAAVPGAATPALQALRDHGKITPGQKVLINGASGGLGTFAVQIAKSMGALVTGVCSGSNLDLVRSLGADQVIDYKQQDFTQTDSCYDIIFDSVAKRSYSECQRVLSTSGVYITTEFSPLLAFQARLISVRRNKKFVPLPPRPPTHDDLVYINELLESKDVIPVIDRIFSLSEISEGLRYLKKGHAQGKIVVTIEHAINS